MMTPGKTIHPAGFFYWGIPKTSSFPTRGMVIPYLSRQSNKTSLGGALRPYLHDVTDDSVAVEVASAYGRVSPQKRPLLLLRCKVPPFWIQRKSNKEGRCATLGFSQISAFLLACVKGKPIGNHLSGEGSLAKEDEIPLAKHMPPGKGALGIDSPVLLCFFLHTNCSPLAPGGFLKTDPGQDNENEPKNRIDAPSGSDPPWGREPSTRKNHFLASCSGQPSTKSPSAHMTMMKQQAIGLRRI